MLSKILTSSTLLLAMAASAAAADLPSEKGPPVYAPPPPPAFSWTGVYIGGQVGYDWSERTSYFDETAVTPLNGLSQKGVIGGGHVGANYELGSLGTFIPGFGGIIPGNGGLVIGVEGDVNGASSHDSTFDPAAGFYSLRENEDFSIRGRIGLAFDRVLIYGTGGGAYGNFHTSYNDTDFFNTGHFGWTAGGGIEYAIDNNWSVRAEYRYTDYGRFSDSPVTSVTFDTISHHIRENRVQAGFSYKFDMFSPPAPVVSKY